MRRQREKDDRAPVADTIGTGIIHLNALCYDSAWSTRPAGQFAAIQNPCVACCRRCLGDHQGTEPPPGRSVSGAHFLDLPALSCLRGIARRRWRYRGGQDDDDGGFGRIDR
jgi:hypothetical protein